MAEQPRSPEHDPRTWWAQPVTAVRISIDSLLGAARWCGGSIQDKNHPGDPDTLLVPHVEAPFTVQYGDWLVQDPNGRFRQMSNREFITQYQLNRPHDPNHKSSGPCR